MLDYTNYFTEIESYFQCKRNAFTLCSCLDWVLMETWKDRGVPLEAVFRGIDRAFAKPGSDKKIGSLAYCAKAIEQVCDEQKELRVERPVLPDVTTDEIAAFIDKLVLSVQRVGGRFPEFVSRYDAIAQTIRELDLANLRQAEQTLNALEEKLIALFKVACADEVMFETRREVDSELNPFRSRMTAEQLTMLEQQMWRRKLMERFEVPRLSLFYLI
jgi:hypothetical protein